MGPDQYNSTHDRWQRDGDPTSLSSLEPKLTHRLIWNQTSAGGGLPMSILQTHQAEAPSKHTTTTSLPAPRPRSKLEVHMHSMVGCGRLAPYRFEKMRWNYTFVSFLYLHLVLFLLLSNRAPECMAFLHNPLVARISPMTATTTTHIRIMVPVGMTLQASDNEISPDNDQGPLEVKKPSFFDLLRPISSCQVNRMSGTDLAYIGDVVFELFVRSRYVWPSLRTSDLQQMVVECVRAENQAQMLASLKEKFPLSTKEQQIINRGRNAVTRSRNNRRDPATYQDSTAFEAFIGYLYIEDQARCQEVLTWLASQVLDQQDGQDTQNKKDY